jgi:hypothetical protein
VHAASGAAGVAVLTSLRQLAHSLEPGQVVIVEFLRPSECGLERFERRQANHPDASIPIRLAAPMRDRDLANHVVCIRGQEFPGFVDQYLKQSRLRSPPRGWHES